MNEVERFTHKGKTVKIMLDTDPPDPREWDNLGTLACWHRRAKLGDEQIAPCSEEELRERHPDIIAVLPLYLYEHGGRTMNTRGFSCPWDSGQVGWAYVTKASAEKMGCVGDRYSYNVTEADGRPVKVGVWDEEALKDSIRGEVETYDQYLRGEVYGYEVEGREGDHLDSCWGFYGSLEYVRSEARGAAEHCEDPCRRRTRDGDE